MFVNLGNEEIWGLARVHDIIDHECFGGFDLILGLEYAKNINNH